MPLDSSGSLVQRGHEQYESGRKCGTISCSIYRYAWSVRQSFISRGSTIACRLIYFITLPFAFCTFHGTRPSSARPQSSKPRRQRPRSAAASLSFREKIVANNLPHALLDTRDVGRQVPPKASHRVVRRQSAGAATRCARKTPSQPSHQLQSRTAKAEPKARGKNSSSWSKAHRVYRCRQGVSVGGMSRLRRGAGNRDKASKRGDRKLSQPTRLCSLCRCNLAWRCKLLDEDTGGPKCLSEFCWHDKLGRLVPDRIITGETPGVLPKDNRVSPQLFNHTGISPDSARQTAPESAPPSLEEEAHGNPTEETQFSPRETELHNAVRPTLERRKSLSLNAGRRYVGPRRLRHWSNLDYPGGRRLSPEPPPGRTAGGQVRGLTSMPGTLHGRNYWGRAYSARRDTAPRGLWRKGVASAPLAPGRKPTHVASDEAQVPGNGHRGCERGSVPSCGDFTETKIGTDYASSTSRRVNAELSGGSSLERRRLLETKLDNAPTKLVCESEEGNPIPFSSAGRSIGKACCYGGLCVRDLSRKERREGFYGESSTCKRAAGHATMLVEAQRGDPQVTRWCVYCLRVVCSEIYFRNRFDVLISTKLFHSTDSGRSLPRSPVKSRGCGFSQEPCNARCGRNEFHPRLPIPSNSMDI